MNNVIIRNEAQCDGCGVCSASCPQMVYASPIKKIAPAIEHPDRCFGCMACEEDCPKHAMHVYRLPAEMEIEQLTEPGRGLEDGTVYDLVIIGAGPAGLG